jgi:hypothetical protein
LSADAWIVDFIDGSSSPTIGSLSYYVRCVR